MIPIEIKIALTALIILWAGVTWGNYEIKNNGNASWLTAFISVCSVVVVVVSTLIGLWS